MCFFAFFILPCWEKSVPLLSQTLINKPKKKGANYAVILQQSAKGQPARPERREKVVYNPQKRGAGGRARGEERQGHSIVFLQCEMRCGAKANGEQDKLVSDETTLNPKEAEMAVYQLEKVMERLLLDGHTVQLGELGSFSLTTNSEACRGEKEVTPDKIKKLNLRFRAGKGIKAALENAKFLPAEDMMSKKK